MRLKSKLKVGIFHKYELNRKGLIALLSDSFICEEIESWEDVENSTADTLILVAPETLCPRVSMEEIKNVIEQHRSNVMMINYDDSNWWIYRMKFSQLRKPTFDQVLNKLNKLNAPIGFGTKASANRKKHKMIRLDG